MSPRNRRPHPRGRREAPIRGTSALNYEAAVILEEVGKQDGLSLWRLLQDAALWVGLEEDERGSAFGDLNDAYSLPLVFELEQTMKALRPLLYAEALASPDLVARACTEISEWAEDRGFIRTSLAFAQVAADALPQSAAYAHRVGMLARLRCEHGRSEIWYRRAATLARNAQDWRSYARSYEGLGLLYRHRGKLKEAKRFHIRSMKAARRHRIRKVLGEALHNLCVISFELGERQEALAFGREAVRIYGPTHPNLPILAHDLAYFWMDLDGAFSRSLPIFQSLLRSFRDPVQRLYLLGSIGRAAGGAGERETFNRAWGATWDLLHLTSNGEGHAPALLELAQGAVSLGLKDQAEVAAGRAQVVAKERREHKLVLTAEAVLGAAERIREERTSVMQELTSSSCDADDEFARELLQSLITGSRRE